MSITNQTIVDIINSVSTTQISATDSATSFKTLGIDSLDVATIFLTIYEELSLRVPDEDIDALDTVDAIVTYLGDMQAKQ